ncbi:MAG TPA: cell division protein FtsL [Casimicrobiaceae bacterium]|jgi:cell division protein FtsL|nr:cell division protein FtsL [Casimicrobiaceae bacterium]
MTRVNLVLLAVLVACALSLVTSRHDARRLYVELERERAHARQFEVEYGQLSLEQSTWAMPARVEKIARESLHMQLPAASRVQVVESPDASAPAPENLAQVAGTGVARR